MIVDCTYFKPQQIMTISGAVGKSHIVGISDSFPQHLKSLRDEISVRLNRAWDMWRM